ncbi:MAG: DUF4272 domain-containing protein [Anaerolineales bacterium]|jgi:hypothetical protein|nr:DUF4272 domain-containing protein [Anaerolineales bacterium]
MPFNLFKSKKQPAEPQGVKAESERTIKALGGRVCDWLPAHERGEMRSAAEVADRALTLHAMIEIAFGAPTEVIAAWIRENNLEASLSRQERALLARRRELLSEEELSSLGWSMEALWALVWAGGLIEALCIERPVGDILASLLPDIHINEDASSFRSRFALRPAEQIHAMLDLYYRAHWYARDGRLKGYPTGAFDLDRIMERRRALEWLSDRSLEDWADTPEDT